MKICSVCQAQYENGGGPGPKKEPLCSAHYFRFLRGSKSWKDPMLRGSAVELSRLRVSAETKDQIDKAYAKALKLRPALPLYTFLAEVIEAGLADALVRDSLRGP